MGKKNSDVDDEDLRQAISEQHHSGSLERKLALAIIRANPSCTHGDERQRMNIALGALLGDRYHKISRYLNLINALHWMADQFVLDRGGPCIDIRSQDPFSYLESDPVGARPVKQLAIEANRCIHNAPSVGYLENEFSKRKRSLCMTTILSSDVPGSLHRQTIAEIQSILEPFGVKMDIGDI